MGEYAATESRRDGGASQAMGKGTFTKPGRPGLTTAWERYAPRAGQEGADEGFYIEDEEGLPPYRPRPEFRPQRNQEMARSINISYTDPGQRGRGGVPTNRWGRGFTGLEGMDRATPNLRGRSMPAADGIFANAMEAEHALLLDPRNDTLKGLSAAYQKRAAEAAELNRDVAADRRAGIVSRSSRGSVRFADGATIVGQKNGDRVLSTRYSGEAAGGRPASTGTGFVTHLQPGERRQPATFTNMETGVAGQSLREAAGKEARTYEQLRPEPRKATLPQDSVQPRPPQTRLPDAWKAPEPRETAMA